MKPFILLIKFLLFYMWEIVWSSILISWDVVTPSSKVSPAIIEVPMEAETPLELTLLANLITFSPGSMCVGLSADQKIMYVHTLFAKSEEAAIRDLKENFERRVLELVRWKS